MPKDFSVADVKTDQGVWKPQYAHHGSAKWVSSWVFVPTASASQQPATPSNTGQKRIDETTSLKLIPFEALNKSQTYANAGDTMPIVFCKRENNSGGVWISPPLLDSSSDNFQHTFVYLLSHGSISIAVVNPNYFLGANSLSDITLGGSLSIYGNYTNVVNNCPLTSSYVTCDHTNFNFLADSLGNNVGDASHTRTVNEYATGVTIRVKPLYPDGVFSPTLLERYTLTVTRFNNATAATTTVGTITTSATGGINSISDTMAAGNYTYSVTITAIHTVQTNKPASILVEFRQANTFPTSYDRTTSYKNISLLVVEGNLFDPTKAYSDPAELKQLHAFIESGLAVIRWRSDNNSISNPGGHTGTTGASNRFADLLYYWFQNSGAYTNQNFSYLSVVGIAVCALFHSNYNITCDIYLTTSTSFLAWVQNVAPMFLCSFYSFYGDYSIKPLLPLADNGTIASGALTPLENFNDLDTDPDSAQNSILVGSYRKTYRSSSQALPFQVVVTWRGQDKFNMETAQTTKVRYSDYSEDAPEEAYDMTDFCTNADHATIFAKYILASRRYSLHTVTFQTGRNVQSGSELEPADLISVSLSRVNSQGDSRTELEHYLVDNLEYDQSGYVTITASQFPLNGAGASIINNSILSGSFVVTT